jgi:hypothetical protein
VTARCHTHGVRSRRLALASAALAAIAGASLTACGDDSSGQGDAEEFCDQAIAHTSVIVAPPLGDEAGLDATLDFYRLMGELAPLSIAEEWNVLVTTLETAADLQPGDPASEQLVAATAYASEPAAYAVKVWLERNCGLDIPITTIAPHEQVPAIATTTVPVAAATTVP